MTSKIKDFEEEEMQDDQMNSNSCQQNGYKTKYPQFKDPAVSGIRRRGRPPKRFMLDGVK